MFLRLLFLLTVIPFIEIYFLLKISDSIGFGNTVLIVLFTGVLGTILLKQQGHSILMEIQKKTAQNQIPSDAIAKGFFTFVGGVLLLTPGVLTDVLGLSLIFAPTQLFWKMYFTSQWQRGVQGGSIRFYTNMSPPRDPFSADPFRETRAHQNEFGRTVIDVEARSATVEKKDEDQ